MAGTPLVPVLVRDNRSGEKALPLVEAAMAERDARAIRGKDEAGRGNLAGLAPPVYRHQSISALHQSTSAARPRSQAPKSSMRRWEVALSSDDIPPRSPIRHPLVERRESGLPEE